MNDNCNIDKSFIKVKDRNCGESYFSIDPKLNNPARHQTLLLDKPPCKNRISLVKQTKNPKGYNDLIHGFYSYKAYVDMTYKQKHMTGKKFKSNYEYDPMDNPMLMSKEIKNNENNKSCYFKPTGDCSLSFIEHTDKLREDLFTSFGSKLNREYV